MTIHEVIFIATPVVVAVLAYGSVVIGDWLRERDARADPGNHVPTGRPERVNIIIRKEYPGGASETTRYEDASLVPEAGSSGR